MSAQTDPGVRPGVAGAGGPMPGLSTQESQRFSAGLAAFQEVLSVTGSKPGTEAGLGPRFNLDSCFGCHNHPALGGSSPALNPQVAMAKDVDRYKNEVPAFITIDGPVREARFKYVDGKSRNIRDGGVHALYTVAGKDAGPGCKIAQPDFDTAAAQDNLVFRIPTPLFGLGLIETITDAAILTNKLADTARKASFGISGHENREGNAGTITRLGWKAQNKSLLIFTGEAYNVEMGVTNELFPQERDEDETCSFTSGIEDHTSFTTGPSKDLSSDAIAFTNFMRFLAPPAAGPVTEGSIKNGLAQFSAVGCALCHTPSLTTGKSPVPALSNKPVPLFSDLLVHNMGSGLADDIIQGSAGPDEFRTAPLWGIGKRIFFLHDGRTKDLLEAIEAHASKGSEANASISAFKALSISDRQDILNFLRSL